MQHRRTTLLAASIIAASMVMAACGDDKNDTTTTTTAASSSAPANTDAPSGEWSLKGVCPDTIVMQMDWMPEAEHGWLYDLIGDGYTMDKAKGYVTGPLVDPVYGDTGVQFQIRSGGKPQGFQPPTQLLYQDKDIFITFVYTDEAIQFSGSFPTVAIESGFDKNPQIIMWDPATYPDVKTIEDLGKTNATVRYFGGAAYMDYLTGSGLLKKSQVDGSYSGDPSLFIADEGKSAQQGYGSSEPYLYEEELADWRKPVAYQYLYDTGWKNYAQSIATKPETIEEYADCFTKLVPTIQRGAVHYVQDPTRANKVIVDAVEAFGTDFGWDYTAGAAAWGAEAINKDHLIANGPAGMGSFDMDRVNELIEIAVPIYEAQGLTLKANVTAEDIVTNRFIDPSIKL